MPVFEEKRLLEVLLSNVPAVYHKLFCQTLDMELPSHILTATSRFMGLLATNAALVATIPYNEAQKVSSVGINVIKNSYIEDGIEYLKRVCCPEIAKFIRACISTEYQDIAGKILIDLGNRVMLRHDQDHIETPPSPITGSYNPALGVAYYFTRTGEKVRQLPNYILKDNKTKV